MRGPALPDGVPQPLDNELLAWAAGFFDGEGSTIAKNDRRRPEYFQLDVSVPQAGHDGVPPVLLKFQRAMLGVGQIYAEPDGLYKWRAGGRVGAELTLALMWPWLGEVKRSQASVALDVVALQYADGRYLARRARYRPTFVAHVVSGQGDESRLELAWAAGFLDAEGYFGLPRMYARRDGSVGFAVRASATQHSLPDIPADVLLRLQRALGVGRIERHGEPDDFKWVAEGMLHVRRVLELVRPWLGRVKVEQASMALAKHQASRVRGDEERCMRGHAYDRIYTRPNGTIHRICTACARMSERKTRAAQGTAPRRFKHPERRLEDPVRRYAA